MRIMIQSQRKKNKKKFLEDLEAVIIKIKKLKWK